MTEPQPSERDRGLPFGGCYEMDYSHFSARPRFSAKKFDEALATARAEGRLAEKMRCWKIADDMKQQERQAPVMTYGRGVVALCIAHAILGDLVGRSYEIDDDVWLPDD